MKKFDTYQTWRTLAVCRKLAAIIGWGDVNEIKKECNTFDFWTENTNPTREEADQLIAKIFNCLIKHARNSNYLNFDQKQRVSNLMKKYNTQLAAEFRAVVELPQEKSATKLKRLGGKAEIAKDSL